MTIMIEALLVLKTEIETQQQFMILKKLDHSTLWTLYASTYKSEYIHKAYMNIYHYFLHKLMSM